MKVRAKFEVVSVTQYPQRKWNEDTHKSEPDGVSLEVRAQAAQGEGNKAWAAASPSGELRIVVSNKAAQPFFEPGKFFYMEFSEAPEKDDPN